MSTYQIQLVVSRPEVSGWGEFAVRKTYKVTKDGKPEGVFGYIIQEVVKKTSATTSDGKTYRTTTEINDLTNGNVMNASDTYYEIFPILNGTTCFGSECIDDQFQNGAILRYTYEDEEWAADDDPSTTGTITMVGTNVFVESDETQAMEIYTKIQRENGGRIVLNGVGWNLSPRTPANGLPFLSSFPPFSTLKGTNATTLHKVTVSWTNRGRTTVVSSPSSGGGRRRLTRGRTASKSRYRRRIGRTRRR